MAVALQQRHELGQKWHQAPRADTIGGSPGDFKRRLDSRTIARGARSANLGGRRQGWARQEQNGIFSGIARGCDKLIENDRLVRVRGLLVAWCDLRSSLAF